jgi:hypothetical protein
MESGQIGRNPIKPLNNHLLPRSCYPGRFLGSSIKAILGQVAHCPVKALHIRSLSMGAVQREADWEKGFIRQVRGRILRYACIRDA